MSLDDLVHFAFVCVCVYVCALTAEANCVLVLTADAIGMDSLFDFAQCLDSQFAAEFCICLACSICVAHCDDCGCFVSVCRAGRGALFFL